MSTEDDIVGRTPAHQRYLKQLLLLLAEIDHFVTLEMHGHTSLAFIEHAYDRLGTRFDKTLHSAAQAYPHHAHRHDTLATAICRCIEQLFAENPCISEQHLMTSSDFENTSTMSVLYQLAKQRQ